MHRYDRSCHVQLHNLTCNGTMLHHNTVRGIGRTVLGIDMPAVQPTPLYTAWGYLVCNELARGVGHQRYYTDDVGMLLSSRTQAALVSQVGV